MKLAVLLAEKRPEIVAKWLHAVFDAYPPETSQFLKREKDQFANPVGYSLSRGVEVILDYLLRDPDLERVLQTLDDIIRIKAVQDFSPSQAMDFLFRLKAVVRAELEAETRENPVLVKELLEFESKIDALALQAFNIFVKCREKIYDLKANQIQNRAFRLLKRANLLVEIPDPEAGLSDVENAK
jgi:hypothetical protein